MRTKSGAVEPFCSGLPTLELYVTCISNILRNVPGCMDDTSVLKHEKEGDIPTSVDIMNDFGVASAKFQTSIASWMIIRM